MHGKRVHLFGEAVLISLIKFEALHLVSPVPFNWPVSVRNVRSPVRLPTDKGASVAKEPPTPDWKERPV